MEEEKKRKWSMEIFIVGEKDRRYEVVSTSHVDAYVSIVKDLSPLYVTGYRVIGIVE